MSHLEAPRPVITCLLHPGDRIVTADGTRATVVSIDEREPRNGKWVECMTSDGMYLQFAASASLLVTRLSANLVGEEPTRFALGRAVVV